MIRRLWFLLSLLWSASMLLLAWITYGQASRYPGSSHSIEEAAFTYLCLAPLPWLIRYAALFLVRYVIRGNGRQRIFRPRY